MAIEIWVEVELWNLKDEPKVESGEKAALKLSAKVDNGSWYTVLPKALADRLQLLRAGRPMKVTYADGRKSQRSVALGLRLRLEGRVITTDALVEPRRKSVLVGSGDLEKLGFNIDLQNECLAPYPGTERGQCAVIE